LRNRQINTGSADPTKTPFEIIFNRKPSLGHLRVWGSIAYAHVPSARRGTEGFRANAERCRLVGYDKATPGIYEFLFKNGRVRRTKDAKIYENRFRFPTSDNKADVVFSLRELEVHRQQEARTCGSEPVLGGVPGVPMDAAGGEDNVCDELKEHRSDAPAIGRVLRPNRGVAPEPWGYDHVYGAIEISAMSEASANVMSTPRSYNEARKSPEWEEWKAAIAREFKSLEDMGTWKWVTLPEGAKALTTRHTFKRKANPVRGTSSFKDRLCARGFAQRFGVDFEDTFAPTLRMQSFRVIVALAARFGLKLTQSDISSAYLNGWLQHDVFITCPEGYPEEKLPDGFDRKRDVLKLIKALYGLKQGGFEWFREFRAHLLSMGFKAGKAEPCVYWFVGKSQGVKLVVIVAVYVDDCVWACKCDTLRDALVKAMSEKYKMRDEGKLEWFLSIEARYSNDGIALHQQKYATDLLARFDVNVKKTKRTALPPGLRLTKREVHEGKADNTGYRMIVGAIMYLMVCTRPDLAYAVQVLSRYLSDPAERHFNAARHTLAYIAGTVDMGLHFSSRRSTDTKSLLSAYSDSDWGGCLDTGRSTGGFVYLMAEAAVCYQARRQTIVASSTAVAEYIALHATFQEGIWLRHLLEDLQLPIQGPVVVFEDNQAAIKIATNLLISDRSKSIRIKFHAVREMVEEKLFDIRNCGTAGMTADIMTKSLGPRKFEQHRRGMGVW
jgi:hypothetical protein